jgi:polysaccharide export outer membrane protein
MIPNMTVLEALALAGGLDQFANQKRIYILRKENGKEFRYPFNYKRAIRGRALDQNILLRPGDLIVVP